MHSPLLRGRKAPDAVQIHLPEPINPLKGALIPALQQPTTDNQKPPCYTAAMEQQSSPFFTSAIRAIKSLPQGKLAGILVFSILLNAAVLAGLVFGSFWLLGQVTWFGEWDGVTDIVFSLFSVTLAYFLFPLLLPLVISFFDTAIADAVEKDEYPQLQKSSEPFWPTLQHDIGFTLKALGLNLLSLPFYFIPGANLIVYYLLNGYLLGTEFFNVVAGRYVTRERADELRRRNRWPVLLCGVSIAFFATIPLINLIAPMWGVVLMVHYFHRVNGHKPKEEI